MSKIQVNEIVNHFDTGAPDCPKGLTVTGFSTYTGGASFSGDVSIGGTLTYEDVTNIDSVGVITAQSGINVSSGSLTVDAFADKDSNYLSLRSGFAPYAVGGIGFAATDHASGNDDGVAIYGHDGISFHTAQTERLRITSTGNVNVSTGGSVYVANGNLVFSTAGTGIDFSATSNGSGTMTSELLDDYEEGTWSPVGADNFNGITNADGAYVKVGRICIVNFQFNYSSLDSIASSAITGLPFEPKNDNPNTGVEATGTVFGSNKIVLVYTQNDTTNLYFETDRPLNGSTSTGADFFRGSLVYMTE